VRSARVIGPADESPQTRTFSYDPDGRLVSACKSPTCAAGFDKVEFAYDGEGHRTSITTTAAGAVATRAFRYQADAIVEERLTDAGHPSGALVRSYTVDDTGTVVKLVIPAPEPDAGTYLPVYDGHGDALNLSKLDPVTGSLTLANSFRYESWGKPATTTHNGVGDLGFRFLYVGEFDVQWDDQLGLGLLYMHARHYSPALGRFLQPDPDRSDANLYAYAANDPLTELDPDGTCFIVCAIANALIDTGIYFATTDRSEWSLGGAAGAAATGAVTGFLGVGLLSKIGKVGALARAGSKLLGKMPRAARAVRRVQTGARSFFDRSPVRAATSCARHSFDGDTLITLADGTQLPIDSLGVGDQVLAWDEASSRTGVYPITAVWAHDDQVTGFVVIDGEAIATTPGHPFYTLERDWVEAADLRLGEHVPSATSGWGLVEHLGWLRGPDRMYDLTVADAHTFFIGEGGWLVHNCSAGKGFSRDQDALIQIAKEVKVRKAPMSHRDAKILEEWRRELRLGGHPPMRHARFPKHGLHINVGPVRHIRIREYDVN
jgi:RHS repeat-associated protein